MRPQVQADRPVDRDAMLSRIAGLFPYLALVTFCGLGSIVYRWCFLALDEGLYYYEARRLLHGDVIYRDFFEHITPGVFFFIKWIWQLAGEHIMSVRYTLFAIYLIEVCLVYWLSHRVLRRASLALLPALLFVVVARQKTWWATSHHTLSHLLLLIAAYLLVRYVEERRQWMSPAIGAVTGAAICTTQHLGILMAIAVLFWLAVWLPWRHGLPLVKPVLGFAAGMAAPLGALLAYLASHGALLAAYQCTWKWVFSEYSPFSKVEYFQGGTDLMAAAWLAMPGWRPLWDLIYLAFIGYAPPVALAIGLMSFVRSAWAHPTEADVQVRVAVHGIVWTMAAALFATALAHPVFWNIAQDSTLTHVFLLAIVPGITLPVKAFPVMSFPKARWEFTRATLDDGRKGLSVSLSIWPPRVGRPALRSLAGLTIFLLLTTAYLDLTARYLRAYGSAVAGRSIRSYIHTPLGRFWSTDPQFASDVSTVLDAIARYTPSRSPIFVYYWSAHLYALSGRTSAVKYNGTLPGYHSPEQVAEMVQDLEERQASMVIRDRVVEMLIDNDDARILDYGVNNIAQEPVALAVARNYRPFLELKSYTVYLPSAPPFE
ncbi:MAG: glycosyltransferase family 39 protein [Acidobacteriota bacterium]